MILETVKSMKIIETFGSRTVGICRSRIFHGAKSRGGSVSRGTEDKNTFGELDSRNGGNMNSRGLNDTVVGTRPLRIFQLSRYLNILNCSVKQKYLF